MGDPVALARSQIGKPYVWAHPLNLAAPNPKSFDCSGLVEWAWWHAGGTKFPFHNSAEMYLQLKAQGRTKPYSQRQPGDAVFYNDGGVIHHVAMVDYDVNNMVEAQRSGVPVKISPIRTFGLMSEVGSFGIGGIVTGGNGSSTPQRPPGGNPPYPVVRTSDGYWSITITGKTYAGLPYFDGKKIKAIPNSAVTRMARWEKPKIGSDQYPNIDHACTSWLSGAHDTTTKENVVDQYVMAYSPPATASPLPGLPEAVGTGKAVVDAAKAAASIPDELGKIADAITSGYFWLRAGEVVLGIVVVAVVLDKAVGSSNNPLHSVASVAGKVA